MQTRLAAWCDRRGHDRLAAAMVALTLLLAGASPLFASEYKAQRFDSDITLGPDGAAEVTETVVFEFESGRFTHVWREIPTDRTDGIEVLSAAMDGHPFGVGDGPGHISLTGRQHLRIEWQFASIGPSTHTFTLAYLARGVIYTDRGGDEFIWQALPGEHPYGIDASRITIRGPVRALAAAVAERHRIDSANVRVNGPVVDVDSRGIESNGYVIVHDRYPAGALAHREPDWRIATEYARRFAPRWMGAAAIVFIGAVLLVLATRPGVPRIDDSGEVADSPPDDLPPALAAALTARGRAAPLQAMAVLVDLADRGALTVRELPRSLGVRRFAIAQVPGRHDLRRHEEQALVSAFGNGGDTVTISRALRRLTRSNRRFAAAVDADLSDLGLLDEERQAGAGRVVALSVVLLAAAGVCALVAIAFVPRFGAYPFAIPAALALAGFAGLIARARTSSLSDEGMSRGVQWQAFRRHLLAVCRGGGPPETAVERRWTAYAIALRLGACWSGYLKRHPESVPPWFAAAATESDAASAAWAAFVGASGVSSAGSAGSTGAAAGGGASGAG